MDAETQSHLFEPFFTTKEQGKGTGLGLSTVYGIISRSGGRISCQSEVGRGTTFAIMFPQCEDSVESAKGETSRKAVRGAETILLAEDETTVRTLARMVLERYGYRVIEAFDGSEALKLASSRREPIDLLVTDMVMPGLNGLKLIQEFSPLHPGAGILVMSGYNDAGLGDSEIRRRGISYIQKPFLPQALATRVREILDRRAASVGGGRR
jgi:CheY-like chemotaxis protein